MNDSKSRRRLLFLLPYPPRLDSTHGGGRVSAQLLAGLVRQHRIGLLFFRGSGEPPVDEILRDACEFVQEVKRPWSGQSTRQRLIRSGRLITHLFSLRPMWVTDWKSKSFAQQVRSIVQAWQPNLVQIEYHIMGQYLSALDACAAPRVLGEFEAGGSSAPYLKRIHPYLNSPIQFLDRLAWRRFEPAIVRKVQTVVVFTERDKQALEKFMLPTPILKIRPGTVIPEQPLNPIGCLPLSLLFVGSFVHPPNVDAAWRLIHKIFPIVGKRYPGLELYIVGSEPPPQFKTGPRVIIVGPVPDLTPYLDRASVFVAPLRLGGGIRIKVLEALAAGKAVVASRLAVEGLDITDRDQICLAESDQDFAARIIDLLSDVDCRMLLARNARTWAAANLGWDRSIEAYEQLYQKLLSDRGTA
jgi:glycosyltransferase involved in cell wall biosynthesis